MSPTHFIIDSVETEDSTYISLQTSYWLTICLCMDPEVEISILYIYSTREKQTTTISVGFQDFEESKH